MMSRVAMTRMLGHSNGSAERSIITWCPGCDCLHPFTVALEGDVPQRGDSTERPTWDWDGNMESPTFSPSMLVYSTVHLCEGEHEPAVCPNPDDCGQPGHMILNDDWRENDNRVLGHPTPHTREPAHGNCHSFLRAGQWEFLSDCAHSLAGQTVPMVPLPDFWTGDDA